jgi:hypothetical protein
MKTIVTMVAAFFGFLCMSAQAEEGHNGWCCVIDAGGSTIKGCKAKCGDDATLAACEKYCNGTIKPGVLGDGPVKPGVGRLPSYFR